MESFRKKSVHLIIGTALAIAAPLVLFPEMFGRDLLAASWQYVLYEFVLYGILGAFVYRCENLAGVFKVAGLALAFRLAVASVFGLIITAAYSMDFKVAMALAHIGYWPGLVAQIILTPLALMPVLKVVAKGRTAPRREPIRAAAVSTVRTPFPGAPVRERSDAVHLAPRPRETVRHEEPIAHPRVTGEFTPAAPSSDINGFDRTVRYVAEHGSVYFAAVVDQEGLLLSNQCRGRLDPEDIAPLAVTFLEWNRELLNKGRFGEAEKIDITLREKRLILGRVGDWCMMVLSERMADDLLNIRINQGLDMLRKYAQERYASGRLNEVEKAYV